jgi:hypothetical protein
MNKKEKHIFEKILKAINKNKKLYEDGPRSISRDGNKLTVLGLCDLACNHLFDDCPTWFKITTYQAHIARAYFYRRTQEEFINELYQEFPGIFEGESRKDVYRYVRKDKCKISKNIPLFD